MSSAGASVLYIDDDPGLARLVQRVLARQGYQVEHVSTSEEGLARLAHGGIDVIALDHFLPTGTGLDFLQSLRDVEGAPPVVYVTGSGETAVAVAALKAGASDYVPKAVGEEFLELLKSAIDQALEKARLQRQRDRAEREVHEAKERAEVLLHEVNHRVANSLALVAALVRMQSNSITDPQAKSILGEIQGRIQAVAGVHRSLYTSHDVRSVEMSGYLTSLLQELEGTMKASGHASAVHVTAEPLTLPTDKAVSIGVIVTELVTNAFKYAYPQSIGGEVRVGFVRAADGKLSLTVADDGVGWRGDAPAKGTGIGSRIVGALARSLGATVEYTGTAGCCVQLGFEV
jgi:two-component sensor histidine kinase/CheY-like chemotaxis protein